MKTWEELIKKLDVYRIWEDEATNYTKQILDDINEWLKESTEKENGGFENNIILKKVYK